MGTIQGAKFSMGYRSAMQRDACRNCSHVRELAPMPLGELPRWRCNKGGFMTTGAAVCNQHKRSAA